ncbi:MAG: NAD(P)-dependent oxidoreductase [Pseudomonadota bacterium]
MRVVLFGGAGFVGLNLAEALSRGGDEVVLFDRQKPPATFAADRVNVHLGDVTDAEAVARALAGAGAAVYGAAITSDALREAASPRTVLDVNLMGWLTVLEAARRTGVGRLVNLSSAGAYGEAAFGTAPLDEATTLPDPRTLYAISKLASERAGARLRDLWGMDVVSVRLSSVFGPWERPTGVRDTLSPPFQVMRAALQGEPVRCERSDVRDWVYAPDVGRAVRALLHHVRPSHDLYNVGPGTSFDLVGWAERLRTRFPALQVSIDAENPTIRTHMPRLRQPLAVDRLRDDLGIAAFAGLEASADDYAAWAARHRDLICA